MGIAGGWFCFLVLVFLYCTVFVEVSRGSVVAVAAAVSGANGFGVMGTVTSMAFLDIDGIKRGSYSDGIGSRSRWRFSWDRCG